MEERAKKTRVVPWYLKTSPMGNVIIHESSLVPLDPESALPCLLSIVLLEKRVNNVQTFREKNDCSIAFRHHDGRYSNAPGADEPAS